MLTRRRPDASPSSRARAEDIRQRLLRVPERQQGRHHRRAAAEDLHRAQPRQAGDARHHAAADLRQRRPAERRHRRRLGRHRGRPHQSAGHRRILRRRRHRGGAGAGGRPQLSARRHRHRQARLRGSADASSCAKAASRRSGLGVSMQDGANIITLGENLKAAMAAIIGRASGRHRGDPDRRPAAASWSDSVSEFVETFVEALGIVLLVSFLSLGWRTGIVVALSVPLVLAIVLTDHVRGRHRPAPHHARRADHRARAAGRRRHHRHRDDGGEDGAGLGPRAAPRPSPGPRPPSRC